MENKIVNDVNFEESVPTVIDLMEKDGDYENEEVAVVKVDRTTNSGRRNRRRNEALKNKKRKAVAENVSLSYDSASYDESKGYVTYPKDSKEKALLKKQTNKRTRAACKNCDEDTSVTPCYKKLLDYKGEREGD